MVVVGGVEIDRGGGGGGRSCRAMGKMVRGWMMGRWSWRGRERWGALGWRGGDMGRRGEEGVREKWRGVR